LSKARPVAGLRRRQIPVGVARPRESSILIARLEKGG
jgi:hypothetical protein